MNELLTLSAASKILGVSTKTLRNWDKSGKLSAIRTAGGHRRLKKTDVEELVGCATICDPLTLVYARVSTAKQQENLERQIGRLLEYCADNRWTVELLKDVGSGLNDKRSGLKKLLKRLRDPAVVRLVIEYKDRLTRYGFSTLEAYCDSVGVHILVLQESDSKEFEQEFSEDIVALIASYSARLYGRRGGRSTKCQQ